ncbi:NAD-dependent epimerase/dehydratase family protein [Flavobacterium sp. CGRL2]
MTKISILGCGWLGFPLAKKLIENGNSVKGSTTSKNKLSILENAGITPFLVTIEADEVSENIDTFLAESEILIIDIPPKLRGNQDFSTTLKMTFVRKIQNLIPFIEKSSVSKVLFVSSTSVYGDDNELVTDETIANPETESGRQLLLAEKILLNNPKLRNYNSTFRRIDWRRPSSS